ncbi:hypothetical protein [Clostridium estertheticum]|nr:hypothetical protein [Clostridium estertheticum]
MCINIYLLSNLENETDGVNNRSSEKRTQKILIKLFKMILK